jgi:hypothetical protein
LKKVASALGRTSCRRRATPASHFVSQRKVAALVQDRLQAVEHRLGGGWISLAVDLLDQAIDLEVGVATPVVAIRVLGAVEREAHVEAGVDRPARERGVEVVRQVQLGQAVDLEQRGRASTPIRRSWACIMTTASARVWLAELVVRSNANGLPSRSRRPSPSWSIQPFSARIFFAAAGSKGQGWSDASCAQRLAGIGPLATRA